MEELIENNIQTKLPFTVDPRPVDHANSVIGARTNRNSAIIDLFCGILGKAPKFGLLTDEGRKALEVLHLIGR